MIFPFLAGDGCAPFIEHARQDGITAEPLAGAAWRSLCQVGDIEVLVGFCSFSVHVSIQLPISCQECGRIQSLPDKGLGSKEMNSQPQPQTGLQRGSYLSLSPFNRCENNDLALRGVESCTKVGPMLPGTRTEAISLPDSISHKTIVPFSPAPARSLPLGANSSESIRPMLALRIAQITRNQ